MSAILSALTASTTNYDDAGKGSKPVLTRTEIAALMNGADKPVADYAWAKYCNDATAFMDVQKHCMYKSEFYAEKYRWNTTADNSKIIRLGQLALLESIHEYACTTCNPSELVGFNRCVCGRKPSKLKHVERSLYVGVCDRRWRYDWRQRYEYLFGYCSVLQSQVDDCINKNNK